MLLFVISENETLIQIATNIENLQKNVHTYYFTLKI